MANSIKLIIEAIENKQYLLMERIRVAKCHKDKNTEFYAKQESDLLQGIKESLQ